MSNASRKIKPKEVKCKDNAVIDITQVNASFYKFSK